MEETLSNALQENIITLLVFDRASAPLIISNIKVELFGNTFYREIARRSIEYYRQYDETPNEHIADLFDAELKDTSKKEIYTKILKALYENKGTVNKEYVLNSLDKFIRLQSLKITAKDLVEALQKNDINKADTILAHSKNVQVNLFDPGIMAFRDMNSSLDFLNKMDTDIIYTGIKPLDDMEICPAPKELYTFLGRSGSGKSWFMAQLGKYAILQRKKVLHITLELQDFRVMARYMQTFFGVAHKEKLDQPKNTVFKMDAFGNIIDMDLIDVIGVPSLRDKDISKVLTNKAKKLMNPQMVVKFFPTGTLSIDGLNAYLDNLESYYNFIPDIVLLDYLDLMDIDTEKMRIDLGKTAVDLRGIAGERNLAMVTVAQTNAKAEGRMILTRRHLAEDFSKVRVSDNLITYNQMDGEKKLGVARLYVDKARNSLDGKSILITQNYSIGQFCLKAIELTNTPNYVEFLKDKGYFSEK
jgi:replicative DNA helicase